MPLSFNIFNFKSKPDSYLGIDIGTLSIKIIELSSDNGRPKLENYAVLTNYNSISEGLAQNGATKSQKVLDGDTSFLLKRLIEEGEVKTKKASMSAPIFSSFLTVMELPEMSELELANAVQFEAGKYIPAPLDTVMLDWYKIGGGDRGLPSGKANILLIAIPKEVVSGYSLLAKEAGLKLSTVELETTAAVRALMGNDPVPTALIDIGSRDTAISIVDGGHLRVSHSIEMSGEDITRAISKNLNIDWRRAEEIKKQSDLRTVENGDQIASVIGLFLSNIAEAAKRLIDSYSLKSNKKVEKLIIYGGASKIPGLVKYMGDSLKIDAIIGNPFNKIVYPAKLKSAIEDIGSEFAVAAGLALKAIL